MRLIDNMEQLHCLEKRPRVIENAAGAGTSAGAAGRGSTDNIERASSKPHIWLQRWRCTNTRFNELRQDCVRCSSIGLTKSTDSDDNRLHTENKIGFAENSRF